VLYVSGSNGTIDNVEMSNGEELEGKTEGNYSGSAVYLTEGAMVEISNSRFVNLIGKSYGGALTMWKTGYTIIENCWFINNTAEIGGAIEIFETTSVVLKDNLFLKNKAIFYGGTGPCCAGGAVAIWNIKSSGLCKDCITEFKGINNFTENYAMSEGSAIAFFSNGFISEKPNQLVMKNNFAKVLNVTVSSYPANITIEFVDN